MNTSSGRTEEWAKRETSSYRVLNLKSLAFTILELLAFTAQLSE